MSTVAFIRRLLASGFTHEDALRAAEAFEATQGEMLPVADLQAQRRRAKDRERKRAAKASGIPRNSAETAEAAEIAETRPLPSSPQTPQQPTPTHESETTHARGDDLDWPDAFPPSAAFLDQLEDALRSAAGACLNAASPGLMVLAPILGLAKAGRGPPCDLRLDVLPTIRSVAQRTQPGRVQSWQFFVSAIERTRDARMTGAGAVSEVPAHERHHAQPATSAKLAAKRANLDRALAGARLAAAQRAE